MKQYFVMGSYTEPILFGTGEVFQGKGKGITICSFEHGEIRVIEELEVRNPSFLCINEKKNKIYAVNEMKEYLGKTGGGVTQISYDEQFRMKVEGSWNTRGTDPCHIAMEPKSQFLAIANFASGAVTSYPLRADGSIDGNAMSFFQHNGRSVNENRQRGPHAHSCIFSMESSRFYVPDLGVDKLLVYDYDGTIIEHEKEADIQVPAGSGPRYGEFSKDGAHFYLINEISSQVMHYTCKNGKLVKVDAVSTLPQDFTGENICSDLHITPNGNFLIASNRGHDSLVCYRIADDGKLEFAERQDCGGKTPRNFAIDPTGHYLLVGNQDSDRIVVFSIDANGHMEKVSQFATGSPVCIRFF
ncbi:MAG: lactonase family protein [Lachnospiraceae bacterium]|nr:lactonase family protein [Lachnospiraceae bacterium]